jgi:hypothetical protein
MYSCEIQRSENLAESSKESCLKKGCFVNVAVVDDGDV